MEENYVEYDFGVDINSDWDFKNGDLILVSNEDNIKQAISNRLNTGLNELDLLYYEYGSVLLNFIGFKRNSTTLNLIKLEIENCLNLDKRISNYIVDVEYGNDEEVKINLKISDINNNNITTNLILGQDSVEVVD